MIKTFPALVWVVVQLSLMPAVVRVHAEEPAPGPPKEETEQKDFRKMGAAHLAVIVSQPWAKSWSAATLKEIRLVPPKPGMAHPTGLPAAWHALISGPEDKSGYLMWEDEGDGGLIEFALDDSLPCDSPAGKALTGVTPLQQFPLTAGKEGKSIASGCVPTAGASVFDFWVRRVFLRAGTVSPIPGENLSMEDFTRRLRARIHMMAIPDKDGFTTTGMDLAGANPAELASAIQAEADDRKLPVKAVFSSFRFEKLKAEIQAGRPALLSCMVRVPHKPELSWGHEVAATGYLEMGGARFAGILDNFYPVKNLATIRWIRQDAFLSLITVQPVEKP